MNSKIKYHFKNLSLLNTLFLLLTPPAAIVLTSLWVYFDGFKFEVLFLGILFYIFSGISITAGYHRLFAHKSYDAHLIVKIFFLIFGAAAFQNSVLKWSSDHRIHHKDVDTDEDPYNINEGFFYAHMGWILLKANNEFNGKYVKDLTRDKWVVFQHKHYFKIASFFGIILPTLLGGILFDTFLGGLAVGALLKIVLLHHSTFFINSLCHYVGTTPYTDSNTAKDSWFMALLTFGEGYHNFHHFFQTDFRNGIKWFQFDPTKWLIQVLSHLKLAYKLKKTPNFKIISAQLQMKLQNAKARYKIDDSKLAELTRIKENIVESMKNFEDIKNQYNSAKKNLPKLKQLELSRRFKQAKIDFHYHLETFHVLLQNQNFA